MTTSPLAGRLATAAQLTDLPRLLAAYYTESPEPSHAGQRVTFGTSGHRGCSLDGSFNEAHILAITQAICAYRRVTGVNGPLFLGCDTHALSEPARRSALEVLVANGVDVMLDSRERYTPTPVVSWAILDHNEGRTGGLADGIVITPSHNPPRFGGFKYNPPSGGPAQTRATAWIAERANAILDGGLRQIARVPFDRARLAPCIHSFDYLGSYVTALERVVDVEVLRGCALTIGVDPLGGASVDYWEPIAARYGIKLDVVNREVDPSFRFMALDWDGEIRMDPSSPYAMSNLVESSARFDLAIATDTDADRHGIVTRTAGLLNPNQYLAVAIDYLFRHRPQWRGDLAIGKTVVSSSLIDRVAARLDHPLIEVPVGFKWFVEGLLDGSLGFAGEESAGASFLRQDGRVWTSDKDGILLGLLAAEITARTGRDPGERYRALTAQLGEPVYERIDAPASPEERAALARLAPEDVKVDSLAGESINRVLTSTAQGLPIGGIKVVTDRGWFAARPSGTESIYKLYAESFSGAQHLRRIQEEARVIIGRVLKRRSSENQG